MNPLLRLANRLLRTRRHDMTVTEVEFAGAPEARTADLFDLSGIPEPEPFSAPDFQADQKYGTYVATREPQFRTHENYAHAKRALTMSNSRLFGGGTTALADAAIYVRVDHGDGTHEWVPNGTYPAGAELPWRTRSAQ